MDIWFPVIIKNFHSRIKAEASSEGHPFNLDSMHLEVFVIYLNGKSAAIPGPDFEAAKIGGADMH